MSTISMSQSNPIDSANIRSPLASVGRALLGFNGRSVLMGSSNPRNVCDGNGA